MLASQELDPDVFLWDSPDRLAAYAAGDYDVETVLKHTLLVKAFSRALTLGCKPDAIKPSYAGAAEDARVYVIGVRVLSGLERGKSGWVLSSDARWLDGRLLGEARPAAHVRL